jgi:hypothetical protein
LLNFFVNQLSQPSISLLLISTATRKEIGNFQLKLSLHTLFAIVILFQINLECDAVAFVLATLVFWSRLYLSRHSILENVASSSVGIVGGITAAWWP